MTAPVAHTIAGIAPGHRPTAAEVLAFEASFCAAACSMPSHRGGRILGHVGAVMPALQCQAIPNTVSWIDQVPPACGAFSGRYGQDEINAAIDQRFHTKLFDLLPDDAYNQVKSSRRSSGRLP